MTHPQAIALIESTAAQLGEFFPSVQILVSMPVEGGGTRSIKRGCGDWYARQGLAREFVFEDQASDLANLIAKRLEPPPDGEEWKKP